MNTPTLETVVTFGDLVRLTGADREHHVRHSLQRLKIKPVRRAGMLNLYPPDAVDLVRADLNRRRRPGC